MTRLRIILLSRRFWPLVGGAEIVMANLAAGLRDLGFATTILTARWQTDWPREIEHRRVRVVRLPNPGLRFWGTLRYMRHVRRWLSAHRDEFDVVYVSMLKHDAYAAIEAARRSRFPVVLRAEGAGLSGDVHWQLEANFGRRIKERCREAAALVAPSRAIEDELIAAGYPRDRVHRIANGVRIPPPADEAARRQVRTALAASESGLMVDVDAPLAVYAGRLHAAKGLDDLVDAWGAVVASRPTARLWIVGDGPHRPQLERHIRQTGFAASIVLAGAFDNVDDILQAANVFVLPSHEEGMSMALLEAMAQGLPIVASDIPGNRTLIDDERHGLLVPTADAHAMARAIGRLLDDVPLAAQLGDTARRRAAAEFSLDRMTHEHVRIFQSVAAQFAPGATS